MADQFVFLGSDDFERWARGARSTNYRSALSQWEEANDYFFDRTQELVHVITGALKRSGGKDVWIEGGRVVAEVGYGDEGVVYADFEFDRGGPHDALGLGWEASQEKFMEVFGDSWLDAVEAWD